ncbi:MAG: serine hydrolase [Micropepsaceae bacterium]
MARGIAAALAALFTIHLAAAQDEAPPPPLDPVAVETFIDGVVESARRDKGIAGVTVAVVGRDGVLMEKGYGLASLEPRQDVDPALTQFRIASISKTFTYVMAMQLAAEGKLDLQAPADTYLPDALKLAGDGFAPPRVIDLMQHTAGFEDSALGHLFMRQDGVGLEDYLVRYRPKRVRPPGSAAVYSNYSVGLLGLIIERLDGRSFEASAEARLFTPLGMTGVTFREPSIIGDIKPSQGFKRSAGWYAPQPFFYVGQIGPAAGANATAHGMTPWMRMLLNGGALDGRTILDPARFAEMAAISFRDSPVSGGIAHGFLSRRYGALTSLEHDGSGLYFHSSMVAWPQAGLAIFVAVNTDTGAPLAGALPTLFIEHFVAAARPAAPETAEPGPAVRDSIAGAYVIERRNHTTFEGFLQRAIDVTRITPRADGTVMLTTGSGTFRYVFEGPEVLRALESGARLQILKNPDGSVYGYSGASGVNRGRKLGAIDTPLALQAASAALLVLSFWVLIARLVRLRFGALRGQGWGERIASVAQGLAALAWLAAAALLIMAVMPLFDTDVAVFDYPSPFLREAQMALHVAAGLSLFLVPMLFLAWTGPKWRLRRVTFTLYAVLALAVVGLLWRWGALLTPLGVGV